MKQLTYNWSVTITTLTLLLEDMMTKKSLSFGIKPQVQIAVHDEERILIKLLTSLNKYITATISLPRITIYLRYHCKTQL